MDLTKEQLSELICKHSERENGLHDLLEIMLESIMVSERREYLREEGLLFKAIFKKFPIKKKVI